MKKKVLTLLLAVTMAMGVPMTAFAADETVAATDISKHTFTAYQIFTGTYSECELGNGS